MMVSLQARSISTTLPGSQLARHHNTVRLHKSLSPSVSNASKGLIRTVSLFNPIYKSQRSQPCKASAFPPLPPSGSDLTIEQREKLQLGTALRNIGWLSFWSQLILTTVSGVILLFSTGMTSNGQISINSMDICTLIGVSCGLITTFLSWTWIRTGRKLSFLQDVKLQQCMGTVLASTNLNLIGMGATIIGLQAAIGGLVAKTLTSAASVGYYGARNAQPPVAFDVFSVQACANTIMAHFAGLVLAQWLLRVVSKYLQREEEREYAPSAPPLPSS